MPGASAHAAVAMSNAPTMDASQPSWVTTPETPGRTGCPVTIDRGVVADRAPISVAHVSAAATASAPNDAAYHRKISAPSACDDIRMTYAAMAQTAAAPPLASTCAASRAPRLRCAVTP